MNDDIGARLRRLRTEAGLTQAELAAKVGVRQSAIGNIETGLRGYGASIVQIAAALKTTPIYLQSGTGKSGRDANQADQVIDKDLQAMMLLVSAIPEDVRTDALLEATQVLIGYLPRKQSVAKPAQDARETQANKV